MLNKINILALLLLYQSQLLAQPNNFRFDFGSGSAAKNYIRITPATKFNYQIGYGFDQGSVVESIDRGGNALTGDYITSSKPFYFSVKLPEGNYDAKLLLGDAKGTSATTVRAECRRLMLENIRTTKGQIVTQNFTVHVKDSLIKDLQGNVINQIINELISTACQIIVFSYFIFLTGKNRFVRYHYPSRLLQR